MEQSFEEKMDEVQEELLTLINEKVPGAIADMESNDNQANTTQDGRISAIENKISENEEKRNTSISQNKKHIEENNLELKKLTEEYNNALLKTEIDNASKIKKEIESLMEENKRYRLAIEAIEREVYEYSEDDINMILIKHFIYDDKSEQIINVLENVKSELESYIDAARQHALKEKEKRQARGIKIVGICEKLYGKEYIAGHHCGRYAEATTRFEKGIIKGLEETEIGKTIKEFY